MERRRVEASRRLNLTLAGLLKAALRDAVRSRDYPAALERAGQIPFLATGEGRDNGPLDPFHFLRDHDLVRRILTGCHDPKKKGTIPSTPALKADALTKGGRF